eukprot:GHVU01127745.1.p1 GENE.GHVU01127745.1~~GHVU01127745.1.p1  ORF type:complete len:220 (+),score=17.09 GHVU01127745.1:826-1485(+)
MLCLHARVCAYMRVYAGQRPTVSVACWCVWMYARVRIGQSGCLSVKYRKLSRLQEMAQNIVDADEAVVVCVAKHLCGAGTDVALRAAASAIRACPRVAVCLVPCCHSRCGSLEDGYVGAELLRMSGLDDASFERVARFTGNATAAGPDEEDRRCGWAAKRLLDLGRLHWLKTVAGFEDVRTFPFVGDSVTPENYIIWASSGLDSRGGVARSSSLESGCP